MPLDISIGIQSNVLTWRAKRPRRARLWEGRRVFSVRLQPAADHTGLWRRSGRKARISPGGAAQSLQWGQGRKQKDSAPHGGRPKVGTLTKSQRERMANHRPLLTSRAGAARHVITAIHVISALRDPPRVTWPTLATWPQTSPGPRRLLFSPS